MQIQLPPPLPLPIPYAFWAKWVGTVALMIVSAIMIGFIVGNSHGFKTAMKSKNLETIRQIATCKP